MECDVKYTLHPPPGSFVPTCLYSATQVNEYTAPRRQFGEVPGETSSISAPGSSSLSDSCFDSGKETAVTAPVSQGKVAELGSLAKER